MSQQKSPEKFFSGKALEILAKSVADKSEVTFQENARRPEFSS